MKELKSKKTGKIQVITEEEYSQMVNSGFDMKRFTITDLRMRTVVPPIKIEKEAKKIIKKV